jgi:hypothetical protein
MRNIAIAKNASSPSYPCWCSFRHHPYMAFPSLGNLSLASWAFVSAGVNVLATASHQRRYSPANALSTQGCISSRTRAKQVLTSVCSWLNASEATSSGGVLAAVVEVEAAAPVAAGLSWCSGGNSCCSARTCGLANPRSRSARRERGCGALLLLLSVSLHLLRPLLPGLLAHGGRGRQI